MSTESRVVLYGAVVRQIRHFIGGTILFNQQVADRVGLHLTDMQCINLLDLLGPSTPGELARCVGLTTGGVTVMLDRLEKAGFVKREPNPRDRRSLLVQVNPKRLAKINLLYVEINRRFGAILEETPEADLKTVLGFFSRMNLVRTEARTGARPAPRGGKRANRGNAEAGRRGIKKSAAEPGHAAG